MKAFTCKKHEEYCPDGVCRWCEPAGLESGAAMVARGVPGSIWAPINHKTYEIWQAAPTAGQPFSWDDLLSRLHDVATARLRPDPVIYVTAEQWRGMFGD